MNFKLLFLCSFNWKDAVEKVWKRMEKAGLVEYDSVNDYYYTP